jgi:hypothetical protein
MIILSSIKAIIEVLFSQNNRKVSIVVSIKTWIVKESRKWYQYQEKLTLSRSRFNFIVPVGKFDLGTVHHCFLYIRKVQKNRKHNHIHKHNPTYQHFNIEDMELDRLKLPLAV